MYIPTLQTLPLNIIFKKDVSDIADILGKNVITFRYGRDAIWWGLKILDIKEWENVLMPASFCDAVIQPFLSLDINIKLYQLDKKLNYNIEEIKRKIDENTRAIYIIHYFGFPQNINPIRRLCDEEKLFLIEDCAHSFLGKYQGRLLGSYGDISIFSLRKFLPVPDGGCLKINRTFKCFPVPELNGWDVKSALTTIKLLSKELAMRNIIPLKSIKKMWSFLNLPKSTPVFNPSENEDKYSYNMKMSFFSENIIKKLNMEEIVRKRTNNYDYWLSNINTLPNFTPIYPYLPEGVNPYSFPVMVEERDRLLKRLEIEGIEPAFNPPFYNLKNLLNKEERFEDSEYIAERLISLPVHQSLNPDLLEKVRRRMVKVL